MLSVSYLLDILKFTLAGIGVVWVAYYLFKPYLDKYERINILEIKKAAANQTIPLRLQAYERLILLVDRINPANLLIRLNAPAYNLTELHSLLVAEIRNEFQHNVSQQVYVSSEAWAITRKIKDDTLVLINNMIGSLPQDAGGLGASKQILAHLNKLEENPYETAATLIKKDLENIF